MDKTFKSPSISPMEAEAIRLWDEVMTISEINKIGAEVHWILTSGENSHLSVSEILAKNQGVVDSVKRLKVIQDLLDSSASGFNEILNKVKAVPKLEGEREKIIGTIKKMAMQENPAQRKLRLNQRMDELVSQGATEREASEKIAAEEVAAGRKPLVAETIRRNYHSQ